MNTQDKQIVSRLQGVRQALNDLECKGIGNHTIVVACDNTLKAVLKALEEGRVEEDGDIYAEPGA